MITRLSLSRLALVSTFVFAFSTCALAAEAASATRQATTSSPTVAHDLNAVDLEAWLDGLVPTALKTAQTPGAVVAVVKGGRVLLEKGYGYADVAKQTTVDPRKTLFRLGSTSKLFTWTAVMQLVEQGKIDLDVDVNSYLDFKIPTRGTTPVTMRQIMKHTTGFEETAKDLIKFDDSSPSLATAVQGYIPPRLFDAGTTSGYSNYATAIAGYIVQRVSGQPFDEYVEQHIFTPLGMRNSSFRQPLPEALRPDMATGYMTTEKPGRGFEIVSVAPAGSLAATADDVTHFMFAHLQNGRYQDAQILKPATAELMHTSVTRPFPALNGIALGFYQQDINGHRVVAHGGDTIYFHSDLWLFLDDDIGIFISVNAPGKDAMGGAIRDRLFQAFADRYLPGPPQPVERVEEATAKAHASLIAGHWISTRRADSTFVSLVGLLSPANVVANPDGTVSAGLGVPKRFVEVKPFLWYEIDGHDRLEAIIRDGKVWRWSTDSIAFAFAFERPAGLAGSGAETPLGIAALAILVVSAFLWPSLALVRRYHGVMLPLAAGRLRTYRLVRAAAWLSLIALVLWAQVFSQVEDFSKNLDVWLRIAQVTSLIAFVGGLVASIVYAVMTWRSDAAGQLAKIWSVLMVAAFAVVLWIAVGYHLVGLSGNY